MCYLGGTTPAVLPLISRDECVWYVPRPTISLKKCQHTLFLQKTHLIYALVRNTRASLAPFSHIPHPTQVKPTTDDIVHRTCCRESRSGWWCRYHKAGARIRRCAETGSASAEGVKWQHRVSTGTRDLKPQKAAGGWMHREGPRPCTAIGALQTSVSRRSLGAASARQFSDAEGV